MLLVNLAEGDDPCRWLVAAAATGLVEAEGLECPGEREEENGWSDEDADKEVGEAGVLQELCEGHGLSCRRIGWH